MEDIESEGKTVAEAVENALKKAGLRRDQVEVQILQEASSGFIGIGAKPARVRIREKRWAADGSELPKEQAPAAPHARQGNHRAHTKVEEPRPRREPARGQRQQRGHAERSRSRPAPPEARPERQAEPAGENSKPAPKTEEELKSACALAETTLKELLPLMGIQDAGLSSRWDGVQERIKVQVETGESERLIGRDGKVLSSLQFLVTLIVTRRLNSPIAVWVDTQGFWEKKEQSLLAEAQKGIEQVKSTGKPYRMAPMDPSLRRLIHRSLANDPNVITASEGEGSWRKIVLKPRK